MFDTARRGALIIGIVLVVGSASRGAEMSTTNHPLPSYLSIDAYLGDPNQDGALLATIGPLAVTGTANVQSILDGAGNGNFVIAESSFAAESTTGTLDLGPLGTVDFVLADAAITFAMETKPVIGNAYEFPLDETVTLIFSHGTVAFQNATGVLLNLLGPGVLYFRDFTTTPYQTNPDNSDGLPFFGTVDEGPGLFSPQGEMNFFMPSTTTLFDNLGAGFPPLYLNFHGEVYVAAPEPSSWALALAGVGGIALLRRRTAGCRTIGRRRRDVAADRGLDCLPIQPRRGF